jgi:Flp pilus assembly protein TadG
MMAGNPLAAVLRDRLCAIWTDCRAVAAVELAFAMPMLVMLFLGSAEVANLLSVHYRSAQMASTVTDAVARYQSITGTDVSGLFSASSHVMGSTDFAEKGYVILSSVTTNASRNVTKISWQCHGGGTQARDSRIGEVGDTVSLPGGLTIDADDNVIVAEVYYRYEPVFDMLPIADEVYKTAVFRPRLGALTSAAGC